MKSPLPAGVPGKTDLRKIIHLDLDAFFCAVEELRDPTLVGKAFAVGGRPEGRGVVASCSYAARQFGVRSAMPMGRAMRLCPDLLVIVPRHHQYGEYSHQVMERLNNVSPLVEQVSIDEAFLDVSDMPQAGESIARELQATIRAELGLPCSLGVAANKLVAKIATDVGKADQKKGVPPNAITVVPPGGEAAFLAPLPVRMLWGIGPKTADRLAEHCILTIGDLASCPEHTLVELFGRSKDEMVARARGIDDSPVVTSHVAKSISQEVTFARDVSDGDVLRQTLRHLSDGVGRQLRADRQYGCTVRLKLRWADFTTITRQVTLDSPTDSDKEIFQSTMGLFEKAWKPGRLVRLIGVGVTGLGAAVRQLSLWDKDHEKDRHLEATLDTLRARFGKNAVKRASQIKK